MSDFSDSGKIARRMMEATRNLHKLAPKVALGRQVKEFIGDMKKNALAREVVKFLKDGKTAVAADFEARATLSFQTELEKLQAEYEAAEGILAQWSAEMCSYEAARSLLSFSKETIRQLE